MSFKITEEDICKISQQIYDFFRNPLLVAEHLKDLDSALAAELSKNEVSFNESELPKSLLVSYGHFLPSVPPPNYLPRHKGHILDDLLLTQEMQNGVNLEGYALKFVGLVDFDLADKIVAEGRIFTENFQITRLITHGPAHRLMLASLMHAENAGVLDFTLSDGNKLTFNKFLELMVYTIYEDNQIEQIKSSLWGFLFDSTYEAEISYGNNPFDSSAFIFSCRVPNYASSLIRDFGNKVGLPNLQFYLLDNYYKATLQFVARAKKHYVEDGYRIEISDSAFYFHCMNFLSTVTNSIAALNHACIFSLTQKQALANPNYEVVYPNSNIVKKKNNTKTFGKYSSWADYYNRKVEKPVLFGDGLKRGFFQPSNNKNIKNPLNANPDLTRVSKKST